MTAPVIRNAIVPIAKLHPHPRNYNAHPQRQIADLAKSLERFGQPKSITVQERADGAYWIVAGHGVTLGAQELDWTELRADILPQDYPEQDVLGFMVADNELRNGADPDVAALAQLLEEQQNAGFDLNALGFTDEGLEQLLADLADDVLASGGRDADDPDGGGDDFDATPDEQQTRVQRGDIWQLGEHRVMCGDSTNADNVAQLMDGKKAAIVFTDPPYAIYGSSTGIGGDITDDKMVRPFWRMILSQLVLYTPIKSHVYLCCDWRSYASWWEEIKAFDLRVANCIVWDKGDGGLGSMYTNRHEFVVFCERHGAKTTMTSKAGMLHSRPVHGRANIMRFSVPQGVERQHNAAKPCALIISCLEASSETRDIVLDLFLGSGTTLIAAERTKRTCYGMEIEPNYANVILSRWEAETGQTATLLHRAETS